MSDHSTISVKDSTKEDLEERKNNGQSFDGVIRDMLEELEE